MNLQSLQSLQSLERLKKMEQKQAKIVFTNLDYREVKIEDDSVIYCDIPYTGTQQYMINGEKNKFDLEAFIQWALKQKEPLIVSSYELPEKYFILLDSIEKRVLTNKKKNEYKQEKLYYPVTQKEFFKFL